MHLSPSSRALSSLPSILACTITYVFFATTAYAAPSPIPIEHPEATSLDSLSIAKRNSADDATDPAKVLAWMEDNVDLGDDRAVFYSGLLVGQPMARAFCEENEEDGYKWFYTIFDQDFSDEFGGANPGDTEVAKACSEAFAEFAKGETRVFNDAGATSTSFWKTVEYPGLNNNADVTNIWNMNDDTTNPDDHTSDLKNNAAETGLRYTPGWCGVHVVQYQKNEGPAASNGGNAGQTSDYRFDITIKDDTGFQIGQALLQDAPTAVGDAVDSALPDALIVTAGQDDNDPVSFAYASQSWTSDDDQCSAGQYDSGSRNMDCGFDCSTTETSDV